MFRFNRIFVDSELIFKSTCPGSSKGIDRTSERNCVSVNAIMQL